jgi:hypothetical protein
MMEQYQHNKDGTMSVPSSFCKATLLHRFIGFPENPFDKDGNLTSKAMECYSYLWWLVGDLAANKIHTQKQLEQFFSKELKGRN